MLLSVMTDSARSKAAAAMGRARTPAKIAAARQNAAKADRAATGARMPVPLPSRLFSLKNGLSHHHMQSNKVLH